MIFFKVSYLIVDEAMRELEMKPDPFLFHGTEIPPSELPYREDQEPPSVYQRSKLRCYRRLRQVSVLKRWTGKFMDHRGHRCQSTRSRLRSLNDNRNGRRSDKPIVNKRVHRMSEMLIEDHEITKKPNSKLKNQRAMAAVKSSASPVALTTNSTPGSISRKEVQFDVSLKSIGEDNHNALYI